MSQPLSQFSNAQSLRHHAPKFTNHIAWTQRWRNRNLSQQQATLVCAMTEDSPEQRRDYGLALRTLAWQAKWRGEMDSARALCEQAIEPLASTANWAALADVYSVLGIVHLSQFRFGAAHRVIKRGFALLDCTGPADSQVDLLTTQASLMCLLGKIDEAGDVLSKAKELARGIEHARLCQNVGRFQLLRGKLRDVRVQAANGIILARASNNRVVLPYLYELLGAVLLKQGQNDLARGVLEDGLLLALEDQDKRVECHLLNLLGTLDIEEGKTVDALKRCERAAHVALDTRYPAVHSGIQTVLDHVPDDGADAPNMTRKRRINDILEKARLS